MSSGRTHTSPQQELDCVCHWFANWAPGERSEFMSDLLLAASPLALCQLDDGLLLCSRLSLSDRQPSLFRCQLRIFRDWFAGWSTDQRNLLVARLEELDPAFASLFYQRLAACSSAAQ